MARELRLTTLMSAHYCVCDFVLWVMKGKVATFWFVTSTTVHLLLAVLGVTSDEGL